MQAKRAPTVQQLQDHTYLRNIDGSLRPPITPDPAVEWVSSEVSISARLKTMSNKTILATLMRYNEATLENELAILMQWIEVYAAYTEEMHFIVPLYNCIVCILLCMHTRCFDVDAIDTAMQENHIVCSYPSTPSPLPMYHDYYR